MDDSYSDTKSFGFWIDTGNVRRRDRMWLGGCCDGRGGEGGRGILHPSLNVSQRTMPRHLGALYPFPLSIIHIFHI